MALRQDSESYPTTDGSVSGTGSTGGVSRRRRHRQHQRRDSSTRPGTESLGIISKLLSSKEVLLTMCLRQGKFAQAEQVVKVR